MPTPLLYSYLREMPAIQARRSLTKVQELLVTSGKQLKQADSDRAINQWSRQAGGNKPRKQQKLTFQALQQLGIPIK